MAASVSASPSKNDRPSSSRSNFSKSLAQRASAARIAGQFRLSSGVRKSPEHADQEIRLQRGLRPVHPAVDASPRERIVRPEFPGAMARGEIAEDGVGFPNDRIVIPDHGDA